jgi:hypothetical protein
LGPGGEQKPGFYGDDHAQAQSLAAQQRLRNLMPRTHTAYRQEEVEAGWANQPLDMDRAADRGISHFAARGAGLGVGRYSNF